MSRCLERSSSLAFDVAPAVHQRSQMLRDVLSTLPMLGWGQRGACAQDIELLLESRILDDQKIQHRDLLVVRQPANIAAHLAAELAWAQFLIIRREDVPEPCQIQIAHEHALDSMSVLRARCGVTAVHRPAFRRPCPPPGESGGGWEGYRLEHGARRAAQSKSDGALDAQPFHHTNVTLRLQPAGIL